MAQITIKNLLTSQNQSLNLLLAKLEQFNRWNGWLAEYPFDEKKILEHCQIVRIEQFKLIMIADNPHWAARLRFYIPELITHLKKYPDFSYIQTIHCKIRPLQYQKQATARQANKLSQESAEMLLDTAQKIENSEALAEAIKKVAGNVDGK